MINNSQLYHRKKELFYCTFEFNNPIDNVLLLKFLILIDRYYPDFRISEQYDASKLIWNDFALDIDFKDEDKFEQYYYFNAPFYIQKGNNINISYIDDGFKFYFVKNKNNELNELHFDLYADVFTNIVYLPTKKGFNGVAQETAASKNRKILSECLKAIEFFLAGEISEYITDYHLTPESIYKYGIKENAVRLNDLTH